MTKVKICGITRAEDAQAAAHAGADAIGFVFAESPRRVSSDRARDIAQSLLPGRCVLVGVFVDETADRMTEIAERVGLHVLQLHGSESPALVEEMESRGFDVVKSFRLGADEKSVRVLEGYRPTAFLLDAYVPGKPGGTGKTFDWRLALDAGRFGRVILSGGLGVDNVREAVRVGSPYGVDASSRLETRPGIKDRHLMEEFIALAKSEGPTPTDDTEPRSPDVWRPWPR
jgi:phosphoribosylanthranilate isomerase